MWRGSVKGLKGEWIPRSRKHRYMLLYDKSLKVKWMEEPYPKGDNAEYVLTVPSQTQVNLFDYLQGGDTNE